jgi:hypothetical protein
MSTKYIHIFCMVMSWVIYILYHEVLNFYYEFFSKIFGLIISLELHNPGKFGFCPFKHSDLFLNFL